MSIKEKSSELTNTVQGRLNEQQKFNFKHKLNDFQEWLEDRGKCPELREGYATATAQDYRYRISQFFRAVWDLTGTQTMSPSSEQANEFVKQLARDDITKQNGNEYSSTSKRKMTNAIQAYFCWRFNSEDTGEEWESPIDFEDGASATPYYFDREERQSLRNAALTYKTIPSYGDLSPEQRDRWKAELAQRTGQKKDEITPDDWEDYNTSFKIPSLIYVALDIGIRPCEVERASVDWLHLENNELQIPKEDAAKNNEYWNVGLGKATVRNLKKWMEERNTRTKYDETDALWLNREGNPYSSRNLSPLLRDLCREAGITVDGRKIVWYSVRHSTGTYLRSVTEGLDEVQRQLRHKSIDSTLNYVHPTKEERQKYMENLP